MLIDISSHAHLILFRVQSFFTIEDPEQASRRLDDSSGYRRRSLRLTVAEYDTVSKSAAATSAPHFGAIKLGEGEHLLRSRGTAGDSFVGFDGIFELYRVYSRHL
jgi:hypothetical protein